MSLYTSQRKAMVDSQIHPSGVIDGRILEAFAQTPREMFVPESRKPMAYNDEDLSFKDGRFIVEPSVHARMIQALEPRDGHVVLDVGCTRGYSSAILSRLVTTVIALEQKQTYLTEAQKSWDELDVCNIASFKGSLKKGAPDYAPYDLIVINGSVATIPEAIAQQLTDGGKMVSILRKPGQRMGQVMLTKHLGEGRVSSHPLFDAASPYLIGFEPAKEFAF